ncbi:MAG TPA: polysaccharide deacetylase family protein [Granulicella sp.]|jgi:peptidoglycan/xylan/chitin deacetylase (PgdA/CDA1 family)|nr:polysaccharide deacetylase family protein [Granulicella sp.]
MTLPGAIPATLAVTAAGLAVGGWFYAALWPASQIFGRSIIAGRDPREIALTYDDGPNTAATPQLLEVLARHNVRATFFLIGDFVRQQPALTREIAAAGHVIGNHTMTHPWLAWQSAARVRRELTDCNRALEDVIGAPVKLFRPPHGARRPVVFCAARELGLKVVQWNVMAYDWKAPQADAEPHARILHHIDAGVRRNQSRGRGSNVLLHDGGQLGMGQSRLATVRATDLFIAAAHQNGSRFVTPESWL